MCVVTRQLFLLICKMTGVSVTLSSGSVAYKPGASSRSNDCNEDIWIKGFVLSDSLPRQD